MVYDEPTDRFFFVGLRRTPPGPPRGRRQANPCPDVKRRRGDSPPVRPPSRAATFLVLSALLLASTAPFVHASPGSYPVDGARDYLTVQETASGHLSPDYGILRIVAPSGKSATYELPRDGHHTVPLAEFHGEGAPGAWTILYEYVEAVQSEVQVHISTPDGVDGAAPGRSIAVQPDEARLATTIFHLVVWDETGDRWLASDPDHDVDPGPLPSVYLSAGGAPAPVLPTQSPEKPYVVVAVLDTGINAHHEAFRRTNLVAHPSTYIQGYPATSQGLDLSQSVDWTQLKRRTLYWFPGTSIVGAYSVGDSDNLRVLYDDEGHGTGTASNVVVANPHAKIVMVETDGATLHDAVKWAAERPWIDVISISWGALVANLPTGGPLANYTRTAVDAGKIVVVSSGNDPTIGHTDSTNGPAWVWSVGGADKTTRGETLVSSKLPDYVSNFTPIVAHEENPSDYTWNLGTSFAAPTVAGVASRVVLNLRQEVGQDVGIVDGALVDAGGLRVTNRDLRQALNRTADYWTAADHRPDAYEPNPVQHPNYVNRWLFLVLGATAPISPTPWTQMGWGYVGPETVGPATRFLLGEAPPPDLLRDAQKLTAKPFMEANYDLRVRLHRPLGICLWQENPEPPCRMPEVCVWPREPGEPCRPPQ